MKTYTGKNVTKTGVIYEYKKYINETGFLNTMVVASFKG
jgi:hypothetical protein